MKNNRERKEEQKKTVLFRNIYVNVEGYELK